MEKGVSDANRAAWIEGDESDIVGPFESVRGEAQTLYPIPWNQIEPADFGGVARVWADELPVSG